MIITRKHLPRRTFLKGLGTMIALPFLDAMTPAFAASSFTKHPVRLAFPYVPNGMKEPNREIARTVARYPGRFIGYAKHDPVNTIGLRQEIAEKIIERGRYGLS